MSKLSQWWSKNVTPLSKKVGSWITDTADMGAEEAAQATAAASDRATQAQVDEAQRARDFAVQRGQIGMDAIAGGRDRGLNAINDAYGRAGGYLDAGLGQARGDLAQMAGLSRYTDSAAQQIDSGGNLAALQNGGLAAGFQADPGFQFRQQQGEQAINRSAAARGGRLGGATLKALAGFNQDLASQEFGNYANRQIGMAQARDQMGLQSGLAAQQNQMGLAGMGYGAQSQLSNLAMQGGTARAQMSQQQGSSLADIESNAASGIANAALGVGSQGTAISSSLMPLLSNGVQYAGGAAAARGQGDANIGKVAAYAGGKLYDWITS